MYMNDLTCFAMHVYSLPGEEEEGAKEQIHPPPPPAFLREVPPPVMCGLASEYI